MALKGGGDGRVREGARKRKRLQSEFFFRIDSAGPLSASMSPGCGTTGRTDQSNHADL